MTWDPYGMPHAPSERPNQRQRDPRYRYQLESPSVSGRAVAAVLGGMAVLALVFTVAANAQQTTTQSTTEQQQVQEEQEAQEQQVQGQDQTTAAGSMQPEPSEQAGAPAPVEGQIVAQPEGTFSASELMGQPVYSAEGEDIGKISDLLLSEDHRLVGVVIGIGGFLGIGEKPIAVEIERLSRVSTQEGAEELVLNYTRAELEQAPEFVSLEQQREEQARLQAQQEAQQQGTGMTQQPATEGQAQ